MDRRSAKGHKTPLGYNTDRGRMALDQYNSLGEHCGPHTASSVFLILIIVSGQKEGWMMLRLVESVGGESKLKEERVPAVQKDKKTKSQKLEDEKFSPSYHWRSGRLDKANTALGKSMVCKRLCHPSKYHTEGHLRLERRQFHHQSLMVMERLQRDYFYYL